MDERSENSAGIVKSKTIRVIEADEPLKLRCGKSLGPIDVTYETYGTLSETGDNAVLICHALSGNAHVAGYNSETDKKPGWWDIMVGPGKGIDTNKYFVICSNFLGGCSGTTGPSDVNPATGKPYGLDFPIITIADMVEVQKLLLDKIGIKQLLSVVGGSMGGMQILQWTIAHPDFVKSAVVAASTMRLNAQSIAFDAVGRNAILADPNFAGGQYHDKEGPDRGLSIARMIGHITYLSEESMRKKFGRALKDAKEYSYDFNSEFAVETYLDHQGRIFVERFDANCYLYITRAMDYFDLAKEFGSVRKALSGAKCRFLVVSFTSDWLFTQAQSKEIVNSLAAENKNVCYCNIDSPYGHDAFLLEPEILGALLNGFISSTYRKETGTEDYINPENNAKEIADSLDGIKSGRIDYELIDSLVAPDSKVLDVGSGDGELLVKLITDKNVTGEGIELDQNCVVYCIGRGLSVMHHDIERGLEQYADNTFDYAILSKTLQTLNNAEKVFKELLRVARKVIVSFPNFGYWRCRLQLLLKGKAPKTRELPYWWYNSPNKHFFSLKDFDAFCKKFNIKVEAKIPLVRSRKTPVKFIPNIFADEAVYLTSKL